VQLGYVTRLQLSNSSASFTAVFPSYALLLVADKPGSRMDYTDTVNVDVSEPMDRSHCTVEPHRLTRYRDLRQ